VTPFDAVALLAMLLTFYPDVSAAALARARTERPAYFSGGTIGGTHGDKFTLPDGRGFDLIFDVENATGTRHWQVIESGPGAGVDDDPFALVPGPLRPLDASAWPAPVPAPVFLSMVGAALAELGASDSVLTLAESAIAVASSPAALEGSYAATLGGIDGVVAGSHYLLDGADPIDIIRNHDAVGAVVDAREGEYDEPPPPDMPGVPDPGGTPPIEYPQ